MLYVREIMELMGSYPGRDFKMVEIVRYVSPKELSLRDRERLRKGIRRAIEALSNSGCVLVRPPRASRGGFAHYRWRD